MSAMQTLEHGAANGRLEPILTDAARWTNVCNPSRCEGSSTRLAQLLKRALHEVDFCAPLIGKAFWVWHWNEARIFIHCARMR